MDIAPFETEQFFERYEFSTPHQLCNSDCESLSVGELLELAGCDIGELASLRLGYTRTRGSDALRAAIAAIYESVRPEEVIVLGTPVEGIYLAARSLLQPGQEVVVLTPAYDALVNLFEHVAGPARVKRWVFRAHDSRWTLDLDELHGLLSDETRLLVLNFPHNPTGYLPAPEVQSTLAELAHDRGITVFCDEMYAGLVHPGTPTVPSMADVLEDAVVLSGLSKSHGLPGLRCGWLVVRDPVLRERFVNWKHYTSICPPAPTEFLAVAALRATPRLIARNLRRIAANLALAEAFFARWPERFHWRPPLAGSTALVGMNVPSVSELSRQLAREEGLLIQSAAMLGGDDHHMRIGLGRDGFGDALARFEGWLQRQ